MRKTALILNGLVAVISLGLLLYTFVFKSHLTTLAGDFVFLKTLEHSERVVSLAEKASSSGFAGKFLPSEKVAVMNDEIELYRKDPSAYVESLVRRDTDQPSAVEEPPAVQKFKNKVADYFESTLNSLIVDLRIFNFSNLLFSLVAIAIVLKRWIRNERLLLVISFIILGATLFGASMYWDGISFFQILFRSYLGWAYPATILFIISYILVKFREVLPKSSSKPPSECLE